MGQYNESWTVPAGSPNVAYVAIGAGGPGRNSGANAFFAGPGGGALSIKENVATIAGQVYQMLRGIGGVHGVAQDGGNTTLRAIAGVIVCEAVGGHISTNAAPTPGGAGGEAAGGTGDVKRSGGNGGVGDAVNDGGAGGGGSAGYTAAGGTGGNAGVTAGAGGNSGDGGAPGKGGNGAIHVTGQIGAAPGGGSGASSDFAAGIDGADGTWAVYLMTDWDSVNHWPKFGATPFASAGVLLASPAVSPKKRKTGYIQ